MSKLSTLVITLIVTVLNGLAVPSSASETSFNSSTVNSSFSSNDYLIYDSDAGILYLPAVEVVNTSGRVEVYQMQLYAMDDLDNPTRFELGNVSLQAELIGKPIRYQPETGILELPEVYVAQQPEPRSFTLELAS